jgi:hypothetical protein
MRLSLHIIGLACGTAFALDCAATSAPWLPPLGEYKIDTTTTTRWNTPTGVMERVEQVDGETGQATVTQRAPDLPTPVVTKVPGQGPIRQCQIAGAPPVSRGNCTAPLYVQGGAANANVLCEGQQQDLEFRKVGEGVWEKRIRVATAATPAQAPGSQHPQAAAAMAAMAAKMEARAKVAPPAEANALRQQIASMQRGSSPASNTPEVESIQRWTWLSNQCTTRR